MIGEMIDDLRRRVNARWHHFLNMGWFINRS